MSYTIWHDRNVVSAQWFMAGVSKLGLAWTTRRIPKPGSAEFLQLPEQLKTILRLDNVDLFATIPVNGRDTPVVIMEITSATPHGQHYKQRLSRVIAACQADVPFVYIIPQTKTTASGTYTLSNGAYFIVQKISSLNQAPAFLYAYPDRSGTLIHDATHAGHPDLTSASMRDAFRTIRSLISARLAGNSLATWRASTWVVRQENALKARVGGHIPQIANFSATLTEIDTADLGAFLLANTSMNRNWVRKTLRGFPPRIMTRAKSLIFKPQGRMFEHSGDPYCGMMAFFDYAFCRIGPTHEDRDKNLIYMPMPASRPQRLEDEFSKDGYHRFWERKTAFRKVAIDNVRDQFRVSHELQYGGVFIMDKPSRIYGYFSDIIVFDNAMLVF